MHGAMTDLSDVGEECGECFGGMRRCDNEPFRGEGGKVDFGQEQSYTMQSRAPLISKSFGTRGISE